MGTMLCSTSPLLQGIEGSGRAGVGTCQHHWGVRVLGWGWGGKPPPWRWLGNQAELPAGNTQGEAPQQQEFPSHSISGGIRPPVGIALGAMCSHPAHPPSHLPQQTCAVCLEDFKVKEELGVLPCQHAFHRK